MLFVQKPCVAVVMGSSLSEKGDSGGKVTWRNSYYARPSLVVSVYEPPIVVSVYEKLKKEIKIII